MHSKSDNIKIMRQMKLSKKSLNNALKDIKLGCKHQLMDVILSLIVLIFCVINCMK